MTATATKEKTRYVPRLKQRYLEEVRERLKDELGLRTIMEVPRIYKFTLKMGVG